MNRKQFAILVVLLVVLGGAGYFVEQSRNRAAGAGEQGAGQKLLGDKFPVNDVAHISIKQGTNELNLVNQSDLWRVRERDNYPANFNQISETLLKARDLKVVQVESVGASQLPRLQLAAGQGTNAGVVVDLQNKDGKSLKTLTLGKKHSAKPQRGQQMGFGDEGFPDGRYVMVGSNSQQALLVADPLNNLEPKPEEWLDKDFFKIERPKTIEVVYPVATNSWKITRDTESGDWKLADAKGDEKLDAARASGVSNPFSSPTFNDVLSPKSSPAESGLDKPTIVTVETFDDFIYTVKVGAKKEDNLSIMVSVAANFPKERVPAKDEKPEDKAKADKAWAERQKQLEDKLKQNKKYENWTYLVSNWTVDPVLKERKDLLVEKKEEPKAGEKTANSSKADDVAFPSGK